MQDGERQGNVALGKKGFGARPVRVDEVARHEETAVGVQARMRRQ
jgi:hypothetical protein